MKKVLKVIGLILLVIVLLFAVFLAVISFTEFKPEPVENATIQQVNAEPAADAASAASDAKTFTVVTMNVGYCGSGAECQWVLDGGVGNGSAESEAIVEKNLNGIIESLAAQEADAYFLQEVDMDSARSKHIEQVTPLAEGLGATAYSFAMNQKVPIDIKPGLPLAKPLGKVRAGLQTVAVTGSIADATRESLPCPFSWPVRCLNLKRCLLITHVDVPGLDHQVALINFHLEAYSDPEGRVAQTKQLVETMERERALGNYVICGGDWNQVFPESVDAFPYKDTTEWRPNSLEDLELPAGYQLAYTVDKPSCRLLNQPYDPTSPLNQYFVIDGFAVSDNVQVQSVDVVDTDFQFSDHNAVKLEVSFL